MPEFNDLPDIFMEYDEFHEEVESSASGSGGNMFQSSSAIEPFRQEDLGDFIRDLNLSKEAEEILAYQLKNTNCLGTTASIAFYSTRE